MTKLKTVIALSILGSLALACGPTITPTLRGGTTGTFSLTAPAIEPPKLTEILSPNSNGRDGVAIDTIVLHHTAMPSTAANIAKFFQDPKSKVSSHYVVDRTGEIIRCVPDDLRSWHAGRSSFQDRPNVNNFSIGIEICNVGDNIEPYPAAQVDAVIRLTAWLAKTHNVPVANLTRHRDVAIPAGRKNDTSDNFDQKYVYKSVQDMLAGRRPAAYRVAKAPASYDPTKLTYTVAPGDTWESIADDLYDAPTAAPALRQINPGITLRPGTVLKRLVSYR
ncbi:MAG: N-acetylmuramoyl-L-alanine amidase [Candidatus Sericytochromatia bacterium]|nr:N-acetylmuramoyl-L-alanine amidase [Candidatus Sericytochromatia bacterium]